MYTANHYLCNSGEKNWVQRRTNANIGAATAVGKKACTSLINETKPLAFAIAELCLSESIS